VKAVATAAEALETMVESPASAVLCDIRLPGHDGLWLASRLRAHWPATPVIMATGLDDLETVRQSRELGAVDYLTKPITADQLQQVVSRVLASRGRTAPPADTAAPGPIGVAEPPPVDAGTRAADHVDAEYTLESPVKCPACGERTTTLKAVRLIRAHVHFTSTLPRRGRVIACPHCLAIVPAELTNF
jgi:DNA-binding response OmpR family regulator